VIKNLIYTDEDKVNEEGVRSQPYFKCNWNLELFYSQNLINHLGVYSADRVKTIGGFRVGFEGAQDYDLALRFIQDINRNGIIHIPRVLYHWRKHEGSISSSQNNKSYAYISGEIALNEHFARTAINATAKILQPGLYRITYKLEEPKPFITLIIPTKNKVGLLRKCINSILTKTTYSNYEILIVDNNSDEKETLNYLRDIQANTKVKCIRDESPFNFSALCNKAVSVSKNNFIGLLNNDVEIITPGWLETMLAIASQPGVGAVGAKLLYPDNTIQHAGVILGIGGVAGHPYKYQPSSNHGYFNRALIQQEMTAVTAACCIMRSSIYLSLGGFDEDNLPVAFNDVDFCIRLRNEGFRNIWTPYAELYHHESASRGKDDTVEKEQRFQKEIEYMHSHWGELLENDPAYSPNLTLKDENFDMAWPPRR